MKAKDKRWYRLLYSVEPKDEQDEPFIEELASKIWFDCENYLDLGKCPFVLKLGEYNAVREEYVWEAEIQVGDIGDDKLVRLSARQEYIAENTANSTENYEGRFMVTMTAKAEREVPCHEGSAHWMGTVMQWAYAYYYEGVHINYPDWITYYLNAPIFDDEHILQEGEVVRLSTDDETYSSDSR